MEAVDSPQAQKSDTIAVKFAKDLTAGLISGGIANYIGHPLDTVKLRMQLSSKRMTTMQVLRKIYKYEGVHGMFKGAVSPLIGRAPVASATYAVNQFTLKMLENSPMNSDLKNLLAGLAAGVAAAPITCPFEHLKVKRQGMRGIAPSYGQIAKTEGFRRMYSGLGCTMARDVPGFGAFFFAYNTAGKVLGTEELKKKGNQNFMVGIHTMIAGA